MFLYAYGFFGIIRTFRENAIRKTSLNFLFFFYVSVWQKKKHQLPIGIGYITGNTITSHDLHTG